MCNFITKEYLVIMKNKKVVLIILIIGKIENKALEKRFTVFDVGHLTEICVKICEKAILLGTATNLIHPDLT